MTDAAEHLVFALCVDVDAEVEDAFNAWYSGEHLPAVVACPGIISGRRYTARTVGDDPGVARYWAFYEVESKDAMRSPEISELAQDGFGPFADRVRNVTRFWFTPLEVDVSA